METEDGIRSVWAVMGRHECLKRELAWRLRHAMTPSEKRLWQQLRANRLAGLPFRRQQILEGFIADFYCHDAALAIEVDGLVHEGQAEYDAERSRIFAACGILTLRFSNSQVTSDIYAVTKAIRTVALDRISPPSAASRLSLPASGKGSLSQ